MQDARLPCDKRMACAAVGRVWTMDLRLGSLARRIGIQKLAPRLCRVPDCHAASAWPMLQSEGAYTLNLRLDSPGRNGSIQKRAPRLCRMPDCYATSAWPMLWSEEVWTLSLRLDFLIGRGLDAEPTIRFLARKGQNARVRVWTLLGERFRGTVRGYSSGR